MLRPLIIDLFEPLALLAVGGLGFVLGKRTHRLPRPLFLASVALGAVVATSLVFMAFAVAARVNTPRDWAGPVLHLVGGERVLACWSAIFLLGVAWSGRRRRFSRGFIGTLVAIAGLLILASGSGRLVWRLLGKEMWHHGVNQDGCLTQTTGLTCSPAAAVMLLDRYGIRTSEGEMAYLARTSPVGGTDSYAMAHALALKVRSRGWTARVRKADYDACLRRGSPFIAHVAMPGVGRHALFVERLTPDHAEIIDPRLGRPDQIDRKTFESWWDGRPIEVVGGER